MVIGFLFCLVLWLCANMFFVVSHAINALAAMAITSPMLGCGLSFAMVFFVFLWCFFIAIVIYL